MKNPGRTLDYFFLSALTLAALLIHGYHLGIEDQAIYLPAVRKLLDPSLYPHDSQFFVPQTSMTLFGKLIAFLIQHTHLSCAAVVFILYVASVFLILLGCLKLSRRLFREPHAQWAGVCLITVLLTMPVAGTGLYLVDQYLDPRALATLALLFALLAVFPGEEPGAAVKNLRPTVSQWLWIILWVAVAAMVHIVMAFYGIGLLVILLWPASRRTDALPAAVVPFIRSLWEPASAAWRKAARTRTYDYLLRWHWYEWLGIAGPLLLLAWFARLGRRYALPRVEHLSRRLALFGLVGLAAAFIMTVPARFERLTPYQPLRSFHLVYVLFILLAGGLLGKWVLRRSGIRWLALFLPLSLGMMYAQLQLFPGSPHIEWPGVRDPNPWVQAFDWIRYNTPQDAYFALNPRFMELPGEDYRGFRAFAERSRMSDDIKDPGVVTLFPNIGNRWLEQVTALQGWKHFTAADFHKLKQRFGVNWVVLEQGPGPELNCPYQNRRVRVCRIE